MISPLDFINVNYRHLTLINVKKCQIITGLYHLILLYIVMKNLVIFVLINIRLILNSIKKNELSLLIFKHLCASSKNYIHSMSFKKDIKRLEMKFNTNILNISSDVNKFKKEMKNIFDIKSNGLCTTILQCLSKFNLKFYRNFLINLTKCN